jgi:cobalamin synthase
MTDEEREEYYKWYSFYHKDGFPKPLMCDTILVAYEGDVMGAAITVQPIIDAVYCMFSFITRNPFCDREFSSRAVDELIKYLPHAGKLIGYTNYISMIGEEPAKKRFRKNGVKESNGSLTLFWGEC